ncbi:MAG: enoyl-CoA hydratase-related protein [Novosphingobium sp.]|nr:enoyl-CoA hydratase-related protein [Novosphingobium sp.]
MTLPMPEDRSYLADLSEGVLTISFNRPDQSNAMKTEMVPLLTELFGEANARDDIRAILMRGEGTHFSGGGDVAGFAKTLELEPEALREEWTGRMMRLRGLVEAVLAFEGPLVVAMRGAVAGVAMSFTLAADHVIGDDSAMFVFAHLGIGASPDGGVSALLPASVGERAARSLLMTGARVKAEEALRIGLLNRLVAGDELEEKALATARRMAKAPQRAIRNAKRLVMEAGSRPIGDHLVAEGAAFIECVSDEDFREGVTAFLNKRKPDFPSTR